VNRLTFWMRFGSLFHRRKVACAALLVAGIGGVLLAQQPSPTSTSASNPTITFTLDFPESDPAHYSLAVDSSGHALYECTAKMQQDSEEQTYKAEFNLSTANRDRIFDWAKQAKYFSGKIDSGNRKLAFTGDKTLSYQDSQRSFTARYNYSSLEPVRDLTTLFQNIAGTQDYGRRLAYYHRYQKLALDEELKHMESQTRNNELSEIQGVAPVLEEIIGDTTVINVVRGRAKAIIQMANAPAGH